MSGRLEDLQARIENLSDSELHQLISVIRKDRTTKKVSAITARAEAKEATKTTDKLRKMLSSLSQEDIKALLSAK
jgi:hypothetical protein